MKEGTIFYNGIDLGSLGTLQMSTRTTPDPPPPGIPSQMVTSFSITISPSASAPATVMRRIEELQTMMKTSEGILKISNEHGAGQQWLVQVGTGNSPQSPTPTSGEFTLELTSSVPLLAPNGPDATFLPEDGSPLITLHSARTISETIGSDRPGRLLTNRTQTTETITFSARAYVPNPTADAPTRLAELQTLRVSLTNLNAKVGTLTIGIEERVGMMIQSVTPKISPDQIYLEIDVQATRKILPGDSKTETTYTSSVADAASDGTITTTYSGSISSVLKADATTKMTALQAAWTTGTRKLVQRTVADRNFEGEDSGGGLSWDGLTFTLVFEEPPPGTSWTLKVNTKRGSGGATTSYSGTVKAPTLVAALAKVVSLAAGKLPVLLSSETTASSRNELGSGDLPGEFVSVDFSYNYSATNTAPISLELTQSTTRPTHGDHSTSLSGSISAPTMAEAEEIANSFIPDGAILTENSRSERRNEATDEVLDPVESTVFASSHVTMTFSLSWRVQHTTVTAKWAEANSLDFTTMTKTTSVNGTIWGNSETAVNLAIAAIYGDHTTSSTPLKNLSVTQNNETPATPPGSQFTVSTGFSFAVITPLTGQTGYDIIEASWSLKRVGQVERAIITSLPCAPPIAQTGFGLTPGSLTASGKIKARQQTTAVTWGQARAASAANSGSTNKTGHALPPTETVQPSYVQFYGATAVLFEFSFSYPYAYVEGLTGKWNAADLVT